MRNEDPERFYKTFRMTPKAFDRLLELVEPYLLKRSWRKAVCPGERLAITLRYLVSGDTFPSLELFFLVAEETISNIVFETTCVIRRVLDPIVFKPSTKEEWLRRASEFEVMWNLVHCVGAIDGKHVRIQAPPRSASRFFNYKDFFSTILMAVCDAKMRFVMVDVGSSGRRGDGNVYHQSVFGKRLREQTLGLPPPCPVDNIEGYLPFYFVGDAAFERSEAMVTPFKGTFLDKEKKLFNYRISRARGRIEDAFGLLCKRFQVLDRPMKVSFSCAKSVILACCALHNYHLMDEDSVTPASVLKRRKYGHYTDSYGEDGSDILGRYSNEDKGLEKIVLERLLAEVSLAEEETGSGEEIPSLTKEDMIEALIDYFIDDDLPWQWKAAKLI